MAPLRGLKLAPILSLVLEIDVGLEPFLRQHRCKRGRQAAGPKVLVAALSSEEEREQSFLGLRGWAYGV